MKPLTAKQMRDLDDWAIHQIGIPGIILMENAASAVVEAIRNVYRNPQRVCVVCGKGNNGGDGFAVARKLLNLGAEVKIFLLSKGEDVSGDAKTNLEIVRNLKIPIVEIHKRVDGVSSARVGGVLTPLEQAIKNSDLIVDAIFGTGFEGIVTGITAKVINLINNSKAYVVAIDIPSGLNATTGRSSKSCIKADLTVTFHAAKRGLLNPKAQKYVGRLIIADIGIPNKAEAKAKAKDKVSITDANYVRKLLPHRAVDAHKKSSGKVLVIAGSSGMAGAAKLTAMAALRSGAGIVKLAVPASILNSLNMPMPEVITVSFEDINLKEPDVIAIGPGLSQSKEAIEMVSRVLKTKIPKVIDADALNIIANDKQLASKLKSSPVIVTPHPGEMARLLNKTTKYVQNNREKVAKEFAKKFGVVVVLKGYHTVIAGPRSRGFNLGGEQISINPTGNPGMASAGVGDVLTGIIAALLSFGLNSFDAALAGVYIHGLSADYIEKKLGSRGLIASDIINALPQALNSI